MLGTIISIFLNLLLPYDDESHEGDFKHGAEGKGVGLDSSHSGDESDVMGKGVAKV